MAKRTLSRLRAFAEKGRGSGLGANAIANLLGTGGFFLAVAVATPFAISALGQTLWGVWQVAGAVAAYATLLNLGLNSAISYEVSSTLSREDELGLAQTIVSAQVYLLVVGCLLAAAVLLIGRPLTNHLVPERLRESAYGVLAVTVGLTGLTLNLRMLPSVLSGLQRYDALAWARIIAAAFLVVLVWQGFEHGMGIIGFAVVMTLAPVIPGFVSLWMCQRLLGNLRWLWSLEFFDGSRLRRMVAYSINTLIYTVGTVFLYQTMKLVAAARGGAIDAGHIGLVVSLAQVLNVGFLPLAGVIHTRIADLQGRGEYAEVRETFRNASSLYFVVAVAGILFVGIETRTILSAWLGTALDARSLDLLADTTRWMLPGQAAYVLTLPSYYGLLGLGRHRFFAATMIAAAAVYVALAMDAGFEFSVGALALRFSFAVVPLLLVAGVFASVRHLHVGPTALATDAIARPVAVSLPAVALVLARPTSISPALDLLLAVSFFVLGLAPGLFWTYRKSGNVRLR